MKPALNSTLNPTLKILLYLRVGIRVEFRVEFQTVALIDWYVKNCTQMTNDYRNEARSWMVQKTFKMGSVSHTQEVCRAHPQEKEKKRKKKEGGCSNTGRHEGNKEEKQGGCVHWAVR